MLPIRFYGSAFAISIARLSLLRQRQPLPPDFRCLFTPSSPALSPQTRQFIFAIFGWQAAAMPFFDIFADSADFR